MLQANGSYWYCAHSLDCWDPYFHNIPARFAPSFHSRASSDKSKVKLGMICCLVWYFGMDLVRICYVIHFFNRTYVLPIFKKETTAVCNPEFLQDQRSVKVMLVRAASIVPWARRIQSRISSLVIEILAVMGGVMEAELRWCHLAVSGLMRSGFTLTYSGLVYACCSRTAGLSYSRCQLHGVLRDCYS